MEEEAGSRPLDHYETLYSIKFLRILNSTNNYICRKYENSRRESRSLQYRLWRYHSHIIELSQFRR